MAEIFPDEVAIRKAIDQLDVLKKNAAYAHSIEMAIEALCAWTWSRWCEDCKEYDHEGHYCHRFTRVIREAVDDMKLVRCKECKHYINHDKRCAIWNHGVAGYGYCYEGERRDDA